MNKLLLTVVACFMAVTTFAQAPASFNFQGVARDAFGNILKSQNVSLRVSINQSIRFSES